MEVPANNEAALALAALAYPHVFAQLNTIHELATHTNVRFGPPLSEQTLREWEERHFCLLPLEYRLFLMLLGNGAKGSHGEWWKDLLPLPHPGSSFHNDGQPLNLSEAFPLVDDWRKIHRDQQTDSYASALLEAEASLEKGCLKIQSNPNTDEYLSMSYLVLKGEKAGSVWCLMAYHQSDEDWEVAVSPWDNFLSWYDDQFSN